MYTLDQVLRPEFPRSWHEAVALVQALADALGPITSVPTAEDLVLEEDGTLVLGFASETAGNPVTKLGRLLVQLLDGVDTPPALQSLAVDNAKTPPAQPTVAAFSRALSFYERPDRRGDLRAVAERLASQHAAVNAEEELQRIRERIAAASEPAEPAPVTKERARPRLMSRQAAMAAVIVIALMGTFAGVRLVRGSGLMPVKLAGAGVDSPGRAVSPPAAVATAERDDTTATAAPASSPVAGAPAPVTPASPSLNPAPVSNNRVATGALPVLAKQAPQRSGAPADSPPPVAKAPVVSTATRWPPPPKAASRVAEAQVATNGFPASPTAASVAPMPAPVPPVGSWTNSSRRGAREVRSAANGKAESVQMRTDEPSRVYSAADTDVRPARLLRSQLPQEPAAGADTGYFELTVDEAGDVEFVRLISPTHRYQDRILVAAAKAWKFRPAMLNGRPVKYRLSIAIILREPR